MHNNVTSSGGDKDLSASRGEGYRYDQIPSPAGGRLSGEPSDHAADQQSRRAEGQPAGQTAGQARSQPDDQDNAQPNGVPRGEQASGSSGIPEATVARLPVYLRALYGLAERGVSTVASEELAAAAGVNSAKLRKDLSHLGSYGIRGVGYDVDYLVYQVSRTLGLTQDWPVVIVGAGNLGHALANYGGFVSRGFRIAALLDSDPAIVGSTVAKLTVCHVDELEAVVARHKVAIGVIATPAGSAQAVCDRLVSAGVTSILNFAPLVLCVPEGVDVRKVDLSIELQILAFHAQRRSVGGRPINGHADEADEAAADRPAADQADQADQAAAGAVDIKVSRLTPAQFGPGRLETAQA